MTQNHLFYKIFHGVMLLAVTLIFYFQPAKSHAESLCFSEAAGMYNVDPLLLKSVAIVESNLRKNAIGINKNTAGHILSKDYGIMQINDIHISGLLKKGIINNKEELITDACLNIKVGTSILADHFSRCGMTWQCLGTYNAGFKHNNHRKRIIYARKVYSVYQRLR